MPLPEFSTTKHHNITSKNHKQLARLDYHLQQTMQTIFLLSLFILPAFGKVITDKATRNKYISEANIWFEDEEQSISSKDLYNGPPNPYNLKTHQTITCDFVEPDPTDPIGGTTPKFYCLYNNHGEPVTFKIKYDQQYNSVFQRWGHANEEVYASVVGQRLLWGMGFGADHSVPLTVNCRNCPIEPWTYIQVIQGYDSEDAMSGWMDMKLVASGEWNKKAPLVVFNSTIAYFKIDEYYDTDEIQYYKDSNQSVIGEGLGWNEMFIFPNYHHDDKDNTQTIARSALSVIAAFISHCDNYEGNQAVLCLKVDDDGKPVPAATRLLPSSTNTKKLQKTKDSCKDQPFLYVHDVGGTLGYGWNLKHKNFWPNYFDLQQWLDLSVWSSSATCKVQVHGLPGCSWTGDLQVSEEGRALASRLLQQFTREQITDLFTSARANLMRNDSISDWVDGFFAKLQRDIVNVSCDA